MKRSINTEIAFTYLVSKKKQTLVASLGVTFGIAMYIFMNALISGTNAYFEKMTLSATPHIRLYREPAMSEPLHAMDSTTGALPLIRNPKRINGDERIPQPDQTLQYLRDHPAIIAISPQVSANVLCAQGAMEESGNLSGVNILEQDKMFDITETMIAGNVHTLHHQPDGILIGSGMAQKLNVSTGDYLTVTAASGLAKRMKVVGIFETTIRAVDDTRCYANLAATQQLLRKDRSYITDIYLNIKDYTKADVIGKRLATQTSCSVETWQSANEQSIAARVIRDFIANAVVATILLVAGFGIYNILNMAIYEKIKEIAILKAMGFAGRHIVTIFILQALFIGILGSAAGLAMGYSISKGSAMIYIGKGNLEFLPMAFSAQHYIQGVLFGLVTSFLAGYIPARKASRVDPVEIIRG